MPDFPYILSYYEGIDYSAGKMNGPGCLGQFVCAVPDNESPEMYSFQVNTDPSVLSFGMLMDNYADGERPAMWLNGGIYGTNQFHITPQIEPNDFLGIGIDGLLSSADTDDAIVAQAINVCNGILKFKLLI